MKKWSLTLILLAAITLSGCELAIPGFTSSPPTTPTPSEAEMTTKVASMMTELAAADPTITQTAVPTDTPTTPPPTATNTEEPTATNTSEPTQTPTDTPSAPTETSEAIATATITGIPEVEPKFNGTPVATIPASKTDPRDRLGPPTAGDPLDNPIAWGWPTDTDAYLNVSFVNSAMRLITLQDQYGWRLPMIQPTNNLYAEMTARPGKCTGKDSYGLIVRVPVYNDPVQGYVASVSCDGSFHLFKWDGKDGEKGKTTHLINWKSSTYIRKGENQPNRVGIMTIEDRLIMYVNGHLVGEVKDKSYPSGYLGVFVYQSKTDYFTVDVDEISYWLNPVP